MLKGASVQLDSVASVQLNSLASSLLTLATEFNCTEDNKDEKQRIFFTELLKALRWNRETNSLKTCTLTIGKCSNSTVQSFQEIVMLTAIDLWGMKLPIGLRNQLLRIIREYTVSRQG